MTTHGNVLTFWESEDRSIRVELRRHHGAYLVRTLRAEQTSAQQEVETDTRARQIFERVVSDLWNELRGEK